MGTLVVSVDHGDVLSRAAGDGPIVGEEALADLVTEVGIADPEESEVNCLLEALRIARDLEADGEATTVVAVSGASESVVGNDREIARQMDDLVAEFDPDSAIVVVDSAEDERLVPVIESRVPVDSVDRVIVRQAHDIESTYYLLKQFLADEELRGTVLVPVGLALVAFPLVTMLAGTGVAVAAITAAIGGFFLYKGLGIDDYLEDVPAQARDAFYSGRVSVVIYVVAAGLSLVGLFAGALGVSALDTTGAIVGTMAFVYHSVAWLGAAALAVSTGRLFDEIIRDEEVPSAYLNLPFGVIATGVVIRGFSAYFLQRSGAVAPLYVPELQVGAFSVATFPLTPEERLAVFVVAGVLVSLVGVRIASYLSGTAFRERELPE